MTMTHYVDVFRLLRLSEWQVQLVDFPNLGSIRPFGTWDERTPSQSLPWYDAYHAVKHDRDAQFHRATLRVAIDAVAGAAVALIAQFGWPPVESDRTLAAFRVTHYPEWEPHEAYAPPWLSATNADILTKLRFEGASLTDFADRWHPRPLSSV